MKEQFRGIVRVITAAYGSCKCVYIIEVQSWRMFREKITQASSAACMGRQILFGYDMHHSVDVIL